MADGYPLQGLSQRLPPSNLQAEQALLGAILANNRAYERVASFLDHSHFADPIHGTIYRAIGRKILDGRVADAVSLKGDLEIAGVFDQVGGSAYLAQLLSSMVGIINAAEYGRVILDCWKRRQLINVGESVVNSAFGAEPDQDADAQIISAQRMLTDITAGDGRTDRLVTAGDAVASAIAQAERVYKTGVAPGVIFGMPTIDKALDGLGDGTLTLLGGLPGSGKTALVGQMGKSLGIKAYDEAIAAGLSPEQARKQPGMLLIALDTSAEQIGLRLAAQEAGMSLKDLKNGRLDLVSTQALTMALSRTRNMAFRIRDMIGVPIRLVGPKIRMHLREQPERVVAVDHILVRGAEDDGSRQSRNGLDAQTVSWIAGQLKAIAYATGVPIIALTHTTRPMRDGVVRRPVQSDVKWAGEGDADNVVFVHRPIMLASDTPPPRGRMSDDAYNTIGGPLDLWNKERENMKNLAEIVVAKARQGEPGVHRMRWHGPSTSLLEWDAPAPTAPSPQKLWFDEE